MREECHHARNNCIKELLEMSLQHCSKTKPTRLRDF